MDIFETFRQAADPQKAAPMGAYMRDRFRFLGITTPQRRKLSRAFLTDLARRPVDWEFVRECWRQPEREFQYLATDYLARLAKTLTPDDLPRIGELAVEKSWWDSVDSLHRIVGHIALRYPQVNDTLVAWSLSDNIWLRRLAIDHQLNRHEKTDTELLERILVNNLGQSEFFINKAIGWALRDFSKTDPEWVRRFIARHQDEMASLSIREASKYL